MELGICLKVGRISWNEKMLEAVKGEEDKWLCTGKDTGKASSLRAQVAPHGHHNLLNTDVHLQIINPS